MDRPEFSGPVPYDVMDYIYKLEELLDLISASTDDDYVRELIHDSD